MEPTSNRLLPLVLVSTFLIAVMTVTGVSFQRLKIEYQKDVTKTLQLMSQVTQKSLHRWVDHRKSYINSLAKSNETVTLSRHLKKVPWNKLLGAPEVAKARTYFSNFLKNEQDRDVTLIQPKTYRNLSSPWDSNLGNENIIAKFYPTKLEEVFLKGKTVFIPPIPSDVLLYDDNNQLTQKMPTSFIVAPVFVGREVIAAIALQSSAHSEFNFVSEMGRFNLSGETYLFNQEGIVFTHSRFEDQLAGLGLIDIDSVGSVLNLVLRDPGINLLNKPLPLEPSYQWPFTKVARSALKGESGTDHMGFRDYRGVKVLGAWTWDDELGVGINSQIDLSEALGSFASINNILLGLLISMGLLGFLLATVISSNRKHKERSILLEKINTQKEIQLKERFLSIIVQDLKGPLKTIYGFSRLGEGEDCSARTGREIFSRVKTLTYDMLQFIDDIIHHEMIHKGKIVVKRKKTNLSKVVARVLEQLNPIAQGRGIELNTHLDQPKFIDCDENLIKEVIFSLTNHSIHTLPAGSHIDIDYKEKDFKTLTISDDGEGIDPQTASHLFDYDETMDDEDLEGLPLANDIMKAHRGHILVDSSSQKGTTYSLHFGYGLKTQSDKPTLIRRRKVHRPTRLF